jgi:hypothetical protein
MWSAGVRPETKRQGMIELPLEDRGEVEGFSYLTQKFHELRIEELRFLWA